MALLFQTYVEYHQDKLKSWLDFGDLGLIFKVTGKIGDISLKLIYLLNLCLDSYQAGPSSAIGRAPDS